MITKADKWLMGILVVLSFAGIGISMHTFSASTERAVQISVNGKIERIIPLKAGYHQEFRIGTDKEYNDIVIDNGTVKVVDANCPDQICVNEGYITKVPEQIVCIPNRVLIKIVSDGKPDVDDIAR